MKEFDRYYVRYESEYLEPDVEGKFMLVEDHIVIVERLKDEIEKLALERLEESYDDIYNKGYEVGYNEGNNVGYLQGLMGED
jgi:hypothetical protein